MSSHADMDEHVHRIAGYLKGTEAPDDLDALVAENQRLREALEKIAALDGGEWGARLIASTALDVPF